MTSILHTIAEHAKVRVEEAKKQKPLSEVKKEALAMEPLSGFPFEKALAEGDISFICECKKASPSKGLIAEDFPYVEIAREYERAGASCISVLTEPKWFLGSDRYLQEITEAVSIPCIRKDFTVDEYMIYEAKLLGASAVLLICALLPEETIREYIRICDSLGLSALVEAHDEKEVEMALAAGRGNSYGAPGRSQDHWRKQQKSEGFHSRCPQFRKASQSGSSLCSFRSRERDQNSRGYWCTAESRCEWCADRGDVDAFPG